MLVSLFQSSNCPLLLEALAWHSGYDAWLSEFESLAFDRANGLLVYPADKGVGHSVKWLEAEAAWLYDRQRRSAHLCLALRYHLSIINGSKVGRVAKLMTSCTPSESFTVTWQCAPMSLWHAGHWQLLTLRLFWPSPILLLLQPLCNTAALTGTVTRLQPAVVSYESNLWLKIESSVAGISQRSGYPKDQDHSTIFWISL